LGNAVNIAIDILKKYALCSRCLARQSSRKVSRNVVQVKEKCYICNGLMNRIYELLELIVAALKEYRYKTFLIGAMLPSDMLEREDEIRAKFKIKGTESAKSYLTKELGKRLARKTGKKVDYGRPDVTINIDLVKNDVTVRARAIFLFGRYLKRKRGLGQKQERCSICVGKGCSQCNNTGLSAFDSIEGIIVRKLLAAFKCESAKFTWVGGEDKDSLVLDDGRPFFVKVINPKRRFAKPRGVTKDGVQIKFLKRVQRLPDKPLKFRTKMKLLVECEREINNKYLKKLNALNNTLVTFSGKHGKEVSKKIYKINAKMQKNVLTIMMVIDGGLVIKQFVSGEGMTPNISHIIGCKATCRSFDILNVKFTD
jgi:tRNA pseudouridine synthase 10